MVCVGQEQPVTLGLTKHFQLQAGVLVCCDKTVCKAVSRNIRCLISLRTLILYLTPILLPAWYFLPVLPPASAFSLPSCSLNKVSVGVTQP